MEGADGGHKRKIRAVSVDLDCGDSNISGLSGMVTRSAVEMMADVSVKRGVGESRRSEGQVFITT